MSPKKSRAFAAVAASLALGVVLSACSNGADTAEDQPTSSQSESAAATSEEHNDADVEFAQMMILHHQGALEMAVLAEGRAQSEEVQQLASDIQFAQQPEIDLMTSWLETWGEESPSAEDDMDGMDHSGGHTGMADDDQMQQLEDAGSEFDRMFLEMMIVHHQGAITMSEEEQANGLNQDALELAGKIVADQTAEIDTMEQLLAEM
ncbi:DUF305 domain-containing protein [Cellulomonas hominis]|jgi:uncharacterized protein (DUF305 family)|uniref:DUF305 domain-containing protein n=1 Tax=Cellulomonas hominis TaxID=156981 RepID=UPI001B8FCD68|nr:DUF305 domain-containing protein [Cellulomonas hominis]VTR77176.1 hypothetical protein CHMI_01946 [Cellulomonas hominis]